MLDVGVTLRVDDADVLAACDRAIAFGASPHELNRRIADYFKQVTNERFENQKGPDGQRWAPLKRRTIAARARKGHVPISILTETGVLKSSVTPYFDDIEAGVSTNQPQARIHQLGGRIEISERKQTIYQRYDAKTDELQPRFVKARKSNYAREVKVGAYAIEMPARPYLGIDDNDKARCIAIAQDVLTEVWGGVE